MKKPSHSDLGLIVIVFIIAGIVGFSIAKIFEPKPATETIIDKTEIARLDSLNRRLLDQNVIYKKRLDSINQTISLINKQIEQGHENTKKKVRIISDFNHNSRKRYLDSLWGAESLR